MTEYARQGIVPEAMVNFLALLGWSPGSGNKELFGRDDLIEAFSLEGISNSNAVFNPDKLEWFSAQHIAAMPAEDLACRVEPFLREAGLWLDTWAGPDRAWLLRLIEVLRPRVRRLTDLVEKSRTYLIDTIDLDPEAVAQHLSAPDVTGHLAALREALARVDVFAAQPLEAALRALATERGVKAGALIHPARVAVTGQSASPGIFDVLALLGRDRTLARLDACLREISDG